MYEPDTILTKKEQVEPDSETGETFPYNEVRVIGPSPVSIPRGEWEGTDAAGVIIAPVTNFGSTLDEPFGKLRELYDVKEIPVREIPVNVPIRVINSATAQAGPTPEEVFAEKAPGTPGENGKRGRTKPLGDAGGPPNADGPLGKGRRKNGA